MQESDILMEGLSSRGREKLDLAYQRKLCIKRVCELHPEVEVSIADSIAAGNGGEFAESFRNRHFPGRESATVRELLPFFSLHCVQRVLEHKLR